LTIKKWQTIKTKKYQLKDKHDQKMPDVNTRP